MFQSRWMQRPKGRDRARPRWQAVLWILLVVAIPRAAAAQDAGPDSFTARITEELRRADPEAAVWFEQANEARMRQDWDAAASLYAKVRAAHPDFDHATRRLASVRLTQGKRPEALALAREAVRLRRSPENRMVLASVLAEDDAETPTARAQRQEAVTLVSALIDEVGSDVDALANLATTSITLRDVVLLGRIVKRLESVAPEHFFTAYFGWVLALALNRHDEALAALEQAHERGLTDDQYAEMLAHTRRARPLHSRVLPPAAKIGGLWLGGLLLLLALGMLLSRLTLRALGRVRTVRSGEAAGVDALLRRTYQVVLWLTCGYYYVSVPLVLLGVLGVAGAILYGFFAVGHIPIKLALLVVIVAFVTLWAGVRSFFVSRRDEDPGEHLPQENYPRLRALLQEVAERIGTRPVDSVYMTPGTDLAVLERGGMLRRLRGASERCLILGVGVLEGFRLGPFRAVLGHEYGHFSNRDTAGGGFALAVRRSLLHMAMGLAQGGVAAWYNPAWLFVNGFYRIFLRLSQGASRLQEVLADRFAAFSYGATAFERGLRHVIERSVRFDAHANATIHAVLRDQSALVNLYTAAPQSGPAESDLAKAVEAAIQAEPSPYASHPSPAERFRWVQALGVADSAIDETEVWSLFEDRTAIEEWMTGFVRRNVEAMRAAALEAGVEPGAA